MKTTDQPAALIEIETETRTVEGNGYVEAGAHHTAYFRHQPENVRGCPAGRSQHSVGAAIADLLRRTNDESGTSYTAAQVTVTRHNGQPTPEPEQTGPAALADFLFNRALENGEPIDPRDLPAVAAEWSRDNFTGQLDAATIAAANRQATERFVDSMVRNELDTEAENRTDIPPLPARLARWEALRPAPESVNLTPGEVRFLLWAIPQVDCDRDEGMAAWVAMGGAIALSAKIRAAFPSA